MTFHPQDHTAAADRVIDSLLIREGQARAVDRHRQRFHQAVETAFPGLILVRAVNGVLQQTTTDEVWEHLIGTVPGQGSWFPLMEARRAVDTAHAENTEHVELSVQVRPAPPLRAQTRLVTVADRRRHPRLKGADPVVTAEDRHAAVTQGVDDALYVNEAGHLLEAANGAVVGWNGAELHVSDGARVLDSTTVGLLVADVESGRPGVPFTRVRQCPEGIDTAAVQELWYLNALHGITPVTQLNTSRLQVDDDRLTLWQHLAESWWRPV